MNDIRGRLTRCFAGAFPSVPHDQIPTLSQENTRAWDSIATATLFAVIEEDFGITLHSGELENLDSFTHIFEYLCAFEKRTS